MSSSDKTPMVTLALVETRRYYDVTGAPDVQNEYRRPLTIRPGKLVVTLHNGRVRYASVHGRTALKRGGLGDSQATSWSSHPGREVPAWIADVIARDGLEWEARR